MCCLLTETYCKQVCHKIKSSITGQTQRKAQPAGPVWRDSAEPRCIHYFTYKTHHYFRSGNGKSTLRSSKAPPLCLMRRNNYA